MFCTSCGSSISEDHTFCSSCGRPLPKPLVTARQDDEPIQARPVPPARNAYSTPPVTQYQPTSNASRNLQPAASPIYVTQQVQVASPVILRPPKNVGLAVCLGLFFGPFGLFYASVTGGIIMLVVGLLLTAVTVGLAAPFVWIACAVWAGIAASNDNSAAMTSNRSLTQINRY
jgi:hypothetical protein